MEIEFNDKGILATATITSTLFNLQRHNRAVETALFLNPGVFSRQSGFFILKTELFGKTAHVLKAYKILQAESKR